jgi:hypothetical protein
MHFLSLSRDRGKVNAEGSANTTRTNLQETGTGAKTKVNNNKSTLKGGLNENVLTTASVYVGVSVCTKAKAS